jgi:hypothetical protein
LFRTDDTPASSLAGVVAAHLEGFGVETGDGIGQVKIDFVTLDVNDENGRNHNLVRLAKRIVQAYDKSDAKDLYNGCLKPNDKSFATTEFRRLVNTRRAEIATHIAAVGTHKAACRIPANYNNPAEILRTGVEPHLGAAGVYQRTGRLVRVTREAGKTRRGDPVDILLADTHDIESLTLDVTSVISFVTPKKTGKDEFVDVPKIPEKLMKMLLRLGNWPSTPYLAGVTTGPFLRPDGSVCTESGYDAITGWYLDYNGEPLSVPENPQKGEAEAAAGIMLDLVREFEWSTPSQAAGWLSYLLTLIARPAICGNVPAFVLSASMAGGGKSLLAELACLIAYGTLPAGYQAPSGENADTEWKKSLFAVALSGVPSLVVSNVKTGSAVGNPIIDGLITDAQVTDRILGGSITKTAPWNAVIAFTGNNLGTTADFAPRAIWSCLQSTVEDPRARSGFAHADIKAHVLEFRATYLEQCLTILRWGYLHGQSKPDPDMKNSGSFEQWAAAVRFPIAHLTGRDVAGNGADESVVDEGASELAALMAGLADYSAWRTANGKSVSFPLGELYVDANAYGNETAWPELREVFDFSLPARSFNTLAGRTINSYRNRVMNGGKLVMDLRNKKPFWRIERTR